MVRCHHRERLSADALISKQINVEHLEHLTANWWLRIWQEFDAEQASRLAGRRLDGISIRGKTDMVGLRISPAEGRALARAAVRGDGQIVWE
jgi:hypothetical protein